MTTATSPRQPPALVVRPEAIPAELRGCAQWVGWAWQWVDPRWTKVLRRATDPARNASTTDPDTWGTFAEAMDAYRRGRVDGVGFVFTAEDPYLGIDLDKCRDAQTGALAPWAREILTALDSYSEISPSGTGLHVIVRAAKPAGRCRKGALELYDQGRYFCTTGWRLDGWPATVEDRQAAVEALYAATFGDPQAEKMAMGHGHLRPPTLDDAQLLKLAFSAKNGAKVAALWAGDTSGHGGDHSAADLALLAALRFYTGDDPARLDALFRQSGLMRDKWDERRGAQTYGERTLAKALEGAGEVYHGPGVRPSGASGADVRRPEAEPVEAAEDFDETAATAPRPTAYSDLAVALTFAARFAPVLRYVPELGWLHWDSTRWARVPDVRVMGLARTVCAAVAARAATDPDLKPADQLRVAKGLESAATVAAVERLARADRRLLLDAGALDRDPLLLNTPGGTVDLRTGRLRPHDPEDYCTKRTAATPRGDCPQWRAFLTRVMAGDREPIAYLQRLAGYSLTGLTREECLDFCYGTGGNGKGTFLETLKAVLGDYAVGAPMTTFTETKSEQHPTDLAKLAGARLVIAQEVAEGRHWDAERLKALTGRDTISARFMRRDFFDFVPQFTLIIAGNHRPAFRNVDPALKRRLHLVPFTVTIPKAEQDEGLKDRLQTEEADGILAWALEGCLAWQRDGLTPPAGVVAATEDYLDAEDVFGQWLAECCVVGPGHWARAGALYAAFTRWKTARGEGVPSQRKFAGMLVDRGMTRDRTMAGRIVLGLALAEPDQGDPDAEG